jgi:hypothetical protein
MKMTMLLAVLWLVSQDTATLKPLSDMAASDKYKGEDGGLYGAGQNEPPKEHRAAALKEIEKIVPLDADGKPAKDGKIVLVSIGMSNTTQEFSRFKQAADRDPDKSASVVIVDGAQGGQAAAQWAGKDKRPWAELEKRLQNAGVSPAQVQAAWVKQAEIQQGNLGEFPAHAKKFKDNLQIIVQILKEKFPNLRVVYLSSRIYAGYATTRLNPEPYAYEGAFSVRWLIQDQIKGSAELNFDASKGAVKSALLLWGPYLWANGTTPRKDDQLVYERKDLSDKDGTHPSDSGRQKVAELLLKFFKSNDLAKPWFTRR